MNNRKYFTTFQINILESNPNVLHVSDKAVTYKPEFKLQAVQSNLEGKSPLDIFHEAGFDIQMIGASKPKDCIKRWRSVFKECGEEGLLMERRGKGSTGRPASKSLTAEEKL